MVRHQLRNPFFHPNKHIYHQINPLCPLLIDVVEASLIPNPDNHMINGTKLLNVAGMTRGRRDGILKSEKLRHVVKIGPMHLKGVWYEGT